MRHKKNQQEREIRIIKIRESEKSFLKTGSACSLAIVFNRHHYLDFTGDIVDIIVNYGSHISRRKLFRKLCAVADFSLTNFLSFHYYQPFFTSGHVLTNKIGRARYYFDKEKL